VTQPKCTQPAPTTAALQRRQVMVLPVGLLGATGLWLAPSAKSAWAHAAPEPAGVVRQLRGEASVQSVADLHPRAAHIGMPLMEGDWIRTAADAELHADMADGAYLAARPQTVWRITAHRLEANANDTSWFDLVKGGLRVVSGWIAKSRPPAFRLHTPVATIGIRGTDFEVEHHEPDAQSPEETWGTHQLVNEGETVMVTDAGDLALTAGMAGFVRSAVDAPQPHTGVPGWMRRVRSPMEDLVDEVATDMQARILARLQARSLARTGETLQQRIDRFRAENPDVSLSDRELLQRAARRANRRGANGDPRGPGGRGVGNNNGGNGRGNGSGTGGGNGGGNGGGRR
jgi:hypothetical protein